MDHATLTRSTSTSSMSAPSSQYQEASNISTNKTTNKRQAPQKVPQKKRLKTAHATSNKRQDPQKVPQKEKLKTTQTDSTASRASTSAKCSTHPKNQLSSNISPKSINITYYDVPRLIFAVGYHQRKVISDRSTGDIHLVSPNSNQVRVYDKEGVHQSCYNVGSLAANIWGQPTPEDVCLTADGDVAVTRGDSIEISDVSGTSKAKIGADFSKFGQAASFRGITSDHNGMLYVCDSNNKCVHVFDQSGSLIHSFGTDGHNKLVEPLSVAINPNTAQIYVADKKKKQVNIYNPEGRYESCISKIDLHGVQSFNPEYVSFRSDGLLCISEPYNHRIQLMKEGKLTQTIGRHGSAPGHFCLCTGTEFNKDNDLIVCDWSNDRVQLFSHK